MPILKSTSPASATPQPFSFRDIEKQASALLIRAREQAQAVLAEAQREADGLRSEAKSAGIREGKADGIQLGREQGLAAGTQQALAEARPQLAMLVQSLTAAAGELEKSRHELLNGASLDLARLAVAISRKVIRSAAATEPAIVTDILAQAMKFVIGQNDIKVTVHPTQRTLLLESLPTLQLTWPNLKHVEIVGDDSVSPGGARIITRHGQVDATLDSMVTRIAAEMLGQDDCSRGASAASPQPPP